MDWSKVLGDVLGDAGTGASGGSMFGPVGTAIGAAGGLIGGLIGGSQGPNLNDIYGAVNAPTADQLAAAGKLGPSQLAGLSEDPATRAAQMQALQQMQEVAGAGGMDPQSQAAQAAALQKSAQQDQANRSAVLQQMAMRGQMSGGAGLAAQLAGQQQASQANAMAGTQAASDARTRALQAMQASSGMAGQMRGQDWGIGSEKAQAADAISRFNAANARSALSENFGNQLALAQGKAGAAQTQRGNDVSMGAAAGRLPGALMSGAGGLYDALSDQTQRGNDVSMGAAAGRLPGAYDAFGNPKKQQGSGSADNSNPWPSGSPQPL